MIYKTLLILIFTLLFTIMNFAGDKYKVIFDCDLGGDIDDAFAVAMLLASDDIEILGLCMDFGDTDKRANVACRMLYETGREDIPVYVGRKTKDRYRGQFIWGEGFNKMKPQEEAAADYIIRMLNENPGEIYLLTVGPVPNMKDVVEKDPKALSNAKHIYSMFGSFYMGYDRNPMINAEWNVVADVEASQAFTQNLNNNITYAGLDVTTFVEWDEANMQKVLMRNSPLTDALTGLTTLWRHSTGRETPVLFDCVAIGMLIWPELFSTRPTHVTVTDGGYTIIDESKAPNSLVGMRINKKEFLKRLLDLYMKQNLMRN